MRHLAPFVIVLCAAACSSPVEDTQSETEASISDTITSASSSQCASGEVSWEEACVPQACGTSLYGSYQDADAIFVLEGGTGDGSQDAPAGTVKEGLKLAKDHPKKQLVLGPGVYQEAVSINPVHDGVTVLGRCAELVTLKGKGVTTGRSTVEVDVPGQATMSGVTIRGADFGGTYVWSGTFRLTDAIVSNNEEAGV